MHFTKECLCFKCTVVRLIKEGFQQMNQQITDYVTKATAFEQQTTAALDNIIADQQSLASQIQALKDQIAAGSSTLSPEDAAALDSVLSAAQSNATKAQTQADAVPDLPSPPPTA